QARLQYKIPVRVDEPERLMRSGLLNIRDQAQRCCQSQATKTDISDVVLACQLDQQQHVTALAYHALRRIPHHARREARYIKPQRTQHMAEKQILLEAVPTAAIMNELTLQGR